MTAVRIGLVRLADSAPVLLAEARGLFAAHGLVASVQVEPSWANLIDKLAYGLLDAAVLPAALALATGLGLRGAPVPLLVPLGLSRGGNAVVATEAAAAAAGSDGPPLERARRLAGWMAAQPEPPSVAVVHAFSTHNLLLRYWLAAAGADPDRVMRTVVLPPERVVEVMRAGRIAVFCAGAPWGDLAQREGVGRAVVGGSAIWAGHPEKCLGVARGWGQADPAALTGLLRALLAAGAACDQPEAAPEVARLLAERLGLDEAACRMALPGGDGIETIAFAAGAAWMPWPSQAAWFAAQFRRWGWLTEAADPAEIWRPDLLAPAARAEGVPWPRSAERIEGDHEAAWSVPADPVALALAADTFVDGARFGRDGTQLPKRTAVKWAID